MNNRKKSRIDGTKVFSIVASLVIVAALVIGIVSIVKSTSSDRNKNYLDLNLAGETTTQEKETKEKVVNRETETEKPTEAPTEPVTEAATEAAITPEDEGTPVSGPVFTFNEASSLLWPVEGDIIIGFNMTNTIYFPTLDQYKCSPAICISAEIGTSVLSAAPGVVKDVFVDEITGTTMVISIGDGYELTYGQLGKLAVGIDDVVEAGTVLAEVAKTTRFFTKEGSNLYFQVTKDGVAVDPLLYLIEE